MSSNQRGLTLVEIMIAAALLALTVAVVFGALVSANKISRPELERSLESNLARERLEDLYQAVRQDWWNQSNQLLSAPTDSPTENILLNGTTYKRSYKVRSVPSKDYRNVEVTVQT